MRMNSCSDMNMSHALWLFGMLAILSLAVLIAGFVLTKNGEYVKSVETETVGRAMFWASFLCVISLVVWMMLALIYWWDNLITLVVTVLLCGLVYQLRPIFVRNQEGERVILWLGKGWAKRGNKWERR